MRSSKKDASFEDSALVLGNRLRQVISMLKSPDDQTLMLMHEAVDQWDKFYSKANRQSTLCEHCLRVECECCDADVVPDMGDK